MTTEIAVLNRLGVALAADSAVTISGGGTSKVFNSADKLFELSEQFPVGVMINDNMDCFGVPWEIIIKDFRSEQGSIPRPTVMNWASDFLAFVEKRQDIRATAGGRYAEAVLQNELKILSDDVDAWFWRQKDKTKIRDNVEDVFFEAVKRRDAEIEKIEKIDRIKNINIVSLLIEFNENFINIIGNYLHPFSPSDRLINSIISNVSKSLISKVATRYSSGVIFAGYGKDDPYPTVYSVNVSGFVCDRLKYYDANKGAVVGSLDAGHIVSFAQTDVTDRLLEGVDPSFVRETASYLSVTTEHLAPLIVEELFPGRTRSKTKRVQLVRAILSAIEDVYVKNAAIKFRKEFRKQFEGMIAMMPKVELIELAEALISITAIERKATTDQGTVGGPIDVAFISKHEGFVWIKRKHYFDPHLNPRYFWRKYPPQSGRDQNDSGKLPEVS